MRYTFGVISVLLGINLLGCSDEVSPHSPFVSSDELYTTLTLNYRAIDLSIGAPYDTLPLVATPRTSSGAPISGASSVTWRSEDVKAIAVFPNGVIKALSPVSATRVIATLQYQGITHADTAYVTVTDTPVPPRLTTFSLDVLPGDSVRLAIPGAYTSPTKPLVITATATTGDPLSSLTVDYRSSDPRIATVDPRTGVVTGVDTGRVTIRATAMAYGAAYSDSIMLITTIPTSVRMDIAFSPTRVAPSVVTIGVGGEVLWSNPSGTQAADIIFDDPGAAQPLKSTEAQFVASYFKVPVEGGSIASWVSTPPPETPTAFEYYGWRIRSFPRAGTYRFHSAAHSELHGTVVVR